MGDFVQWGKRENRRTIHKRVTGPARAATANGPWNSARRIRAGFGAGQRWASFGLTATEARTLPLPDYGARVLAGICQAALAAAAGPKSRLIEYRQVPGVVWPRLLES